MVDDVQDSDEAMKDDYEEDEEDEGSLYAPIEATSELGGEKIVEDEDLMKLSLIDPCDYLMLLPRELRDKVCTLSATTCVRAYALTLFLRIQIYGYVLKLDAPISEYGLKFKCMFCPSPSKTASKPTWQSQIYEARNLLRTCHQIRDEGKEVFYEVNSWTLHRARLRETPSVDSSDTARDTQSVFDRIHQINATKHFRHVNMRIPLSPLAYCDFTVPNSVNFDDPVAIHLFELSRHPSVIASHKLDEAAQCELFKAVCLGLVGRRADIFPKLNSITLEVGLHAKKAILDAPNNPLDRCGIIFYVRIKLGRKNGATDTYHYTSTVQILSLESRLLIPSLTWDHKRHMLSPFRHLHDVQSVIVERRWTVRYRQQCVEDGKLVIRTRSLRQQWRFLTVGDMLERAGPGFREFLDLALKYLKIADKDVVEIIENSTEDIQHHLIP